MNDLVLRSAAPTPLPALLSPVHLVRTLGRSSDLIRQFALRYFHARYRGTQLGFLWALVLPLLTLTIYMFLFNVIMAPKIGTVLEQTQSQFAVSLFCKITVFAMFSETVIRSCGLVLDNPNYVTKVVFPLEILPVANVLSTLMFSGFGLSLVLIGRAVFYHGLTWTAALLPLIVLPMVLMGLGLSWFLASLTVFVRDVGNLTVVVVSQFLLFLTPIFFSLSNVPEPWHSIAGLNPLAPIVTAAELAVVQGKVPEWQGVVASGVFGLVLMQLGFAWFMKSKRGFADVL